MQKKAPWFRFYSDFYQHPKTRRLTTEQKVVVGVAWSIACRSPVVGACLIGSDLPATAEDIADEAKLPLEVVREALGTPENPGPVTVPGMYLAWDEQGILYSPNWDERQFVDGDQTRAERQRRFREKRTAQGPEPDG